MTDPELILALQVESLNARQVIREFMAYVKCGQVPPDAECVKRGKKFLASPIASHPAEKAAPDKPC